MVKGAQESGREQTDLDLFRCFEWHLPYKLHAALESTAALCWLHSELVSSNASVQSYIPAESIMHIVFVCNNTWHSTRRMSNNDRNNYLFSDVHPDLLRPTINPFFFFFPPTQMQAAVRVLFWTRKVLNGVLCPTILDFFPHFSHASTQKKKKQRFKPMPTISEWIYLQG